MRIARAVVGGISGLTAVMVAVPASPVSAAPGADDPCAGGGRCVELASADVMGDGEPDRVGVRVYKAADRDPFSRKVKAEVIVTTPAGRRFTYSYREEGMLSAIYGPAPVDGRRGSEVAIGSVPGAHTEFVTVIGYLGGRLVKVPGPGKGGWYDDAGAMYGGGVASVPSAQGAVETCEYQTQMNDSVVAKFAQYTWSGKGWKKSGARREAKYPAVGSLPEGCRSFAIDGMTRVSEF